MRFSDTPRGWLKYFRLADRSLWAAGNVLSGRLLQSAYPFSGRLSLFGTFFSFPDQNLAPQHLRKRRGLHLYSPPTYWWPSRKRPNLISIQAQIFKICLKKVLTSFIFEWYWTFETSTQQNLTNDSSIDASWWEGLRKTPKKISKNFPPTQFLKMSF